MTGLHYGTAGNFRVEELSSIGVPDLDVWYLENKQLMGFVDDDVRF